jgi:hypothetical protein
MAEDYDSFADIQRTWLLALGRRLRAEYDAVLEPAPPRLTALLEQLASATPDRPVGSPRTGG